MVDKYYTPTIEEFHVGFECMALYKNTDTGDVDWKEFTFTEPEELRYLVTNTWALKQEPITAFRVKHLDKEDIESLGFKVKKEFPPNNLYYKNYKIHMYPAHRWNDEFPLVRLWKYSDDSDRGLLQGGEEIFRGTIRNKSELKRILKQLGI